MSKKKKSKARRMIIRKEHKMGESKSGRNRMVMIASLIIAIVAVSIYFGVFASGEENDDVQNIADTRPTQASAPTQASTPTTAPAPTTTPAPTQAPSIRR